MATITAETPTVEQLQAEILRWHEIEAEQDRRIIAAEADAAELEAVAGALALESQEAAEEHAQRLAAALARVRIAESAVATARQRRAAAILGLWEAQAQQLDARALEARQQAEKHAATAAKLLKSLEEHEGCRYAPAAVAGESRIAVGAGGAYLPPPVGIPRSESMRRDALELEHQARNLRSRQMQTQGTVGGEEGDDLAQLAAGDAMSLAPARHLVRRWQAQQRQAFAAMRRPMRNNEMIPARWTLTWRGGEIDPQQSRLYVPRD